MEINNFLNSTTVDISIMFVSAALFKIATELTTSSNASLVSMFKRSSSVASIVEEKFSLHVLREPLPCAH